MSQTADDSTSKGKQSIKSHAGQAKIKQILTRIQEMKAKTRPLRRIRKKKGDTEARETYDQRKMKKDYATLMAEIASILGASLNQTLHQWKNRKDYGVNRTMKITDAITAMVYAYFPHGRFQNELIESIDKLHKAIETYHQDRNKAKKAHEAGGPKRKVKPLDLEENQAEITGSKFDRTFETPKSLRQKLIPKELKNYQNKLDKENRDRKERGETPLTKKEMEKMIQAKKAKLSVLYKKYQKQQHLKLIPAHVVQKVLTHIMSTLEDLKDKEVAKRKKMSKDEIAEANAELGYKFEPRIVSLNDFALFLLEPDISEISSILNSLVDKSVMDLDKEEYPLLFEFKALKDRLQNRMVIDDEGEESASSSEEQSSEVDESSQSSEEEEEEEKPKKSSKKAKKSKSKKSSKSKKKTKSKAKNKKENKKEKKAKKGKKRKDKGEGSKKKKAKRK